MAAKRTFVEELGQFSEELDYRALSDEVREQLKIRILDSIGCCIGALDGEPVRAVREQVDEFGGRGRCTLVGGGQEGGGTSPDRAAFHNGALLRYLDFMDNYMGKKQSCHPSDNFAPVLAASEYAGTNGKIFMLALALAYAVEIKLIDLIPLEEKGFDHTAHLAYSMAAGISRALGLDAKRTAHALAMSGTAFQGLVASRSGYLSHWKGLASATLALGVMNTTFLARRGVTGPLEVLEGKGGLLQATGAGKVKLEWSKEDLQLVTRTPVKAYNAEVHAQSAIEGVLELQKANGLSAAEVEEV
ncbi:MAG: MmgE/PrpD family protein, partial [Chloroflexia bacterium]